MSLMVVRDPSSLKVWITRQPGFILVALAHDPKYSLVRATYRAIADLKKGRIDDTQPQTYQLRDKLSRHKKNRYHTLEHLKNLLSLHHRMTRIDDGNVLLFL